MRLGIKDRITAACEGFVREYEVISITRDDLVAQSCRDAEKVIEPEIHIVVSLFKLDRLEIGVAKSIEAGATSIMIGITSRSSLSLDEQKKEKALRRLEAISRSASMQSRRAQLISVTFVDDFFDGLARVENSLVICEPEGEMLSIDAPVTLVIGPEGGFSDEELQRLRQLGTMWKISPYILRADTAMALAPGLVAAYI